MKLRVASWGCLFLMCVMLRIVKMEEVLFLEGKRCKDGWRCVRKELSR